MSLLIWHEHVTWYCCTLCNCVQCAFLWLLYCTTQLSKSIQHIFHIPYSRKLWRGIKFGSLVVCLSNHQIKIRQNFLLAYIHMVIPYRAAKFKSTNTFKMAIWDSTAKFNSRQCFWLYGTRSVSLTTSGRVHVHTCNSYSSWAFNKINIHALSCL